MSPHGFRVVCAWCTRTLVGAPKGRPVTHSICPSCLEWSLLNPTEQRATGNACAEHADSTDTACTSATKH